MHVITFPLLILLSSVNIEIKSKIIHKITHTHTNTQITSAFDCVCVCMRACSKVKICFFVFFCWSKSCFLVNFWIFVEFYVCFCIPKMPELLKLSIVWLFYKKCFGTTSKFHVHTSHARLYRRVSHDDCKDFPGRSLSFIWNLVNSYGCGLFYYCVNFAPFKNAHSVIEKCNSIHTASQQIQFGPYRVLSMFNPHSKRHSAPKFTLSIIFVNRFIKFKSTFEI